MRNSIKLALMVGVSESNIFLCVCCPSICPSRYLLLNHWAEINQTCYITSSHSKIVREQHYYYSCICRSSICPSRYLLLSYWADLTKTCYITSPHGKSWREQIIFPFVRLASVSLYITLSPPKPGGNQPNSLHHFLS